MLDLVLHIHFEGGPQVGYAVCYYFLPLLPNHVRVISVIYNGVIYFMHILYVSADVYNAELVLTGILKQELNFSLYPSVPCTVQLHICSCYCVYGVFKYIKDASAYVSLTTVTLPGTNSLLNKCTMFVSRAVVLTEFLHCH